jgi:hypothetical protein
MMGLGRANRIGAVGNGAIVVEMLENFSLKVAQLVEESRGNFLEASVKKKCEEKRGMILPGNL